MVISDHANARQTRSCSNANAVAAAREETLSFAKMFWTCRATVCSLITSAAAICAIALARRNQSQHLQLARREPVRLGRRQRPFARDPARRRDARRCSSRPPRARAPPPPRRRAVGTPRPRGHGSGRSRTAPRARATSRPRCATRRARPARRLLRAAPRLAHGRPSPRASRSRTLARAPRARGTRDAALSTSPTASMISTNAGRIRARSSGTVVAALGAGGSPPRRRRTVPARAAAAQAPAAAPIRARSPSCRPPLPRRTRPAAAAALPAGSAQGRAAGFSVSANRSPARRASSSASRHAPSSCSTSARCTRQRPVNATISGCNAHQSARARVHSRARRTSYTSWQARMTPQYTSPVTMGESSSAVTATMLSSSRASPSRTCPALISMWPCPCIARANRSRSPKRSPIRTASSAAAAAATKSPAASCRNITGMSR